MQTVQDRRAAEGVVVCGPSPGGCLQISEGTATGQAPLDVALLTGGQDRHYAVGLSIALLDRNVNLEVIGSDEVDGPEFQENPGIRFRNLHGSQQAASFSSRVIRILAFYARLIRYAATAKPKVFHILWNNKLQMVDRTLLMGLYKLMRKRVVLTVHNVNAGRRDRKDSWLNRATLKCQYKSSDHLFVHTAKMKTELINEFGIKSQKVSVIPYGVNNAVPSTELTGEESRQKLGLREGEKVVLFFGAIKQYKGLEFLVTAFQKISADDEYRLIIAGEQKKGCEEYWRGIREAIERHPSRTKILQKIEFIPDVETEMYFKAADVAVLPYTEIFQSGILFLSYSFGLPVIATNVGSFAEDVVEGESGYICKACDSDDLAMTIQRYFQSALYQELNGKREKIRQAAFNDHSWDAVAEITKNVYTA